MTIRIAPCTCGHCLGILIVKDEDTGRAWVYSIYAEEK